MRSDTGEITAGMVLNFTNGYYSDYELMGAFVATQDFNYMEKAKEFFVFIHKGEKKLLHRWDIRMNFISWLIKNELIVSCNDREISMGDCEFFNGYEWAKELGLER